MPYLERRVQVSWDHISGYRFMPMESLTYWQTKLKSSALAHGLRGSILISSEGINLYLAAPPEALVRWRAENAEWLSQIPLLETTSPIAPFKRLKVQIREELIRINDLSIQPAQYTGEHLDVNTFKRWLDEELPMILLDTRNTFEYEWGSFTRAIHWELSSFCEFIAKAESEMQHLPEQLPIVTFCTGGIRCEKASAILAKAGLKAYQLQGGILNYFKHHGQTHFRGKCFVFDERIALDGNLACSIISAT